MSAVDDFLAEPADSNGWHDTIPDKRAHLTGRVWQYHSHKANRRKPNDDAWADDDGRDIPPRWADV